MVKSDVVSFIKTNKLTLNKLVDRAVSTSNPLIKIQLCSQAAIFAVNNACGTFNSKLLEETIIDLGQSWSLPPEQFEPNSFLHVLSVCYPSGGHTRVCERLIKASPSTQKHSVVLTTQGDRDIPQSLRDVVAEKSGAFVSFEKTLPIDKGLDLRTLASKYEYIILHVHMHDVVPLIAFGTVEFERPVILYNHADHLFWLGCSIADLVINFRTLTAQMDKEYRGISKNYVLPLPVTATELSVKNSSFDIATLKYKLGFKATSKVILTIASAYKYKPFYGMDFIDTVMHILDKNPDAVVLAIGPSKEIPAWKKAFKESKGRINAIGVVPYDQIGVYFQMADLALDSFPMGSSTGLLDVAKYGVPCLSMESPANMLDSFIQAGIACKSTSELIEKAVSFLENSQKENKLLTIIESDHLPNGFSKKLVDLYDAFPKEHHVHDVIQDDRSEISAFELFIAENNLIKHKQLKTKLIYLVRKIIYLYIQFIFPKYMSPKLFDFLSSRGLI